jgi:hypothetical protein
MVEAGEDFPVEAVAEVVSAVSVEEALVVVVHPEVGSNAQSTERRAQCKSPCALSSEP